MPAQLSFGQTDDDQKEDEGWPLLQQHSMPTRLHSIQITFHGKKKSGEGLTRNKFYKNLPI